ncbi:hypothetical protein BE221DRAFT_73921, partial [Ostreococcus tauri]
YFSRTSTIKLEIFPATSVVAPLLCSSNATKLSALDFNTGLIAPWALTSAPSIAFRVSSVKTLSTIARARAFASSTPFRTFCVTLRAARSHRSGPYAYTTANPAIAPTRNKPFIPITGVFTVVTSPSTPAPLFRIEPPSAARPASLAPPTNPRSASRTPSRAIALAFDAATATSPETSGVDASGLSVAPSPNKASTPLDRLGSSERAKSSARAM